MTVIEKHKRKTLKGTVVGNKMTKTVVVSVDRTLQHPVYQKVMTRSSKFYAHDESDSIQVGDVVTIEEMRPMSKLKRWRVVPSKA
ncbi:30S ribosomal protein S17 [Chlamydiales bacterium SCGC AG-110-M15]|nr:30S ribosomal protein S17 [Chlamydiales bacterium SCGC AG-110-M15]